MDHEQYDRIASGHGFIAALDQSGGSTPTALEHYGITAQDYAGDDEMFDLVHQMRARIITDPAFSGDRVIGAILFDMTTDRQVAGRDTADYLWTVKRIVPFVKIDRGLAAEERGVQLMKPIPDLDDVLRRASEKHLFGTKMRSVIRLADPEGIERLVQQQFALAHAIVRRDLVPIIEPEVDISSPDKAEAEELLHAALLRHLAELESDRRVMLKLTLPDRDDRYEDLVRHPRVLRVLALSGGYRREQACERLARNRGVIASFSRALSEGLSAQQTDEEFTRVLGGSIAQIAQASST